MEASSDEIVKEAYKKDEYIFFEGDLDAHLYIVESGQVQIFTKNPQGKRLNIITVQEGESFGEFALLDHQPRSASAQALTDCVVIRVSEQGFEQLLNELPVWASSMMKTFSHRLRHMNKIVKNAFPQFMERE